MAGKKQYKAKQFIDAIKGSGGIITTIAARVGCDWSTAKKYVYEYPTINAAYINECEVNIDRAEGVVLKNIELARTMQNEGKVADTGDAKWYLRMKAKERGYVERQEVAANISGALQVEYVNDWRNQQND